MASKTNKLTWGCVLIPVLYVGSCTGKNIYQEWHYKLPGAVLASPNKPSRTDMQPIDVAEELDLYVQPRFDILRDREFGVFRVIEYKHHAGIVQLKVDSDSEKQHIANVNGAKRDYAISMLHCAPKPGKTTHHNPSLELLYLNRTPISLPYAYGNGSHSRSVEASSAHSLDFVQLETASTTVLPKLMTGAEATAKVKNWDVLMRPVTARTSECVGCHTGAKLGDTLGVMVYAVKTSLNGSVPIAQVR